MISIHISGRRIGEIAFSWKRFTVEEKAEKSAEPAKQEQVTEAKDDERPKLTAASHLASSERRWTPSVLEPDTRTFGFGRN